MRRTVLLFIAIVMVLIMASGVALAASPIKITRLQCDAPEYDHTNLNGEYAVVKNFSNKRVLLVGWSIHDRGNIHTYEFPTGFALGPHGEVKVHTGEGKNRPGDLYWGQPSAVWNNDGDTATLSNHRSAVVSTKSCGL